MFSYRISQMRENQVRNWMSVFMGCRTIEYSNHYYYWSTKKTLIWMKNKSRHSFWIQWMNTMENGSTIDTLVKNPTVVSRGYNSTANNTTADGDPVPNPVVFAMGYSFMAFLSIITGVVGLLANGSVLFILVITKKKKNSSNFLIVFQFVVNVVACALLIVSYTLKLMLDVKGDTMKRWGLTICILFVGDGLAYMASDAAATNLGMIAFERYMKIVHAVKHRTYFRQWVVIVLELDTNLKGCSCGAEVQVRNYEQGRI